MSKLILTPTQNKVLPFKLRGFKTLIEALEYAAQGETGFNFYNSQEELVSVLSYKDMHSNAIKMAHYLLMVGLKKGDYLPVIAETRAEFMSVFFACQYLGVILCPLPTVSSVAESAIFAEKTFKMAALVKAKFIVASEALINNFFIQENKYFQCISYEVLAIEAEKQAANVDTSGFSPIDEDNVSFVQFSSGSTSTPKGIIIYNNGVSEHARVVLEENMRLRSDDRTLSWLPLYHNMGLVGLFLASVAGQRSVDWFSPFTFISQPSIWLKLMSRNKTALTVAPMFAYQLAINAFEQEPFEVNLSSLRIAGLGGDAIRPEIMKKFDQVFSPYGFNYQSFVPSYGMSEAILAISSKRAEEDVVTDIFEGKEIVSCGRALPDYELRVVDDNNQLLPEREVGSIHFKNKMITNAFLAKDRPSFRMADGFIDTGDIGYLYKQNLFILGRKKDMILIRGRNIWAQDIVASLVSSNEWLKAEDILVMGLEINDEEKLVAMVQCDEQYMGNAADNAKKMRAQISKQFGVLADIVFVDSGALPITPSGKVSRAQFKEIYLKAGL